MRGEHLFTQPAWLVAEGSSPRARGARKHDQCAGPQQGIIPACAGSTLRGHLHHPCPRDHPRVRGEHPPGPPPPSLSAGSSPRARGAPSGATSTIPVRGIIPACAGSTSTRSPTCSSGRDHPRVRGEHTQTLTGVGLSSGSSPRARGAPSGATSTIPVRGIIPACAGSTSTRSPTCSSGRDHPRVRGEHIAHLSQPIPERGSSPRARGAHTDADRCRSLVGIIPACAGSTSWRWSRCAGSGDHPRVRGEHTSCGML